MLFPDAVQRGAHKGVNALMGYVLRCAREKYSGGAPRDKLPPDPIGKYLQDGAAKVAQDGRDCGNQPGRSRTRGKS